MPSVLEFPFLKYYLIISFIWIAIFVIFRIYDLFSKEERNDYELINSKFVFLLSISIVGLSIGLIGGNSRNGITDIIVSSILTIVGGLISMSFIKQHLTKEDKLVVEELKSQNIYGAALIGIAISLSIMYGINIGSKVRITNEKFDNDKELIMFEEKLKIEKKYTKE